MNTNLNAELLALRDFLANFDSSIHPLVLSDDESIVADEHFARFLDDWATLYRNVSDVIKPARKMRHDHMLLAHQAAELSSKESKS